MLKFWKKKDLSEELKKTKRVKLDGFLFTIRKINVMDYLDGSKVLKKTYDTYAIGSDKDVTESSFKGVKGHITDVICSGVEKPVITRKGEGESIGIDELFVDWDLAVALYEQIMSFSYGKKKVCTSV